MGADEFFIGWEPEPPRGIVRFVRRRVVLVLLAAPALAFGIAGLQGTIGVARFSGEVREWRGVLLRDPVPMLVVDAADAAGGSRVHYLVDPLKFGFDAGVAEQFHLRHVTLRGTLIHRDDGQAMIEVVPGTVAASGVAGSGDPLGGPERLGRMTLRGEIVDSKCYLGAMNPGVLKPHRACAMLCIEGGIPPILVVRGKGREAGYFLLLDDGGRAVNREILEWVALPVEIEGEVERAGELFVLKAPLSGYRLIE
jgi:hypothetical protein